MSDLDDATPADLEAVPPSPPVRDKSDPAWIFVGPDGIRAGWGMAIFVVLALLIGGLLFFGVSKALHLNLATTPPKSESNLMTPRSAFINEGLQFTTVFLVTLLMAVIERRRVRVYGLGGSRRVPQFFQGLFWGILCLSFLILLLRLTGHLQFDGRLLGNAAALRYGLIWAAVFTLVGFFEEYFFRGYLQYTLSRGLAGIYGAVFKTRHRHALGFWTAAFVLSLSFGAVHSTNPGESSFGLFSVLLAGLFFTLALYRTGSLWWAIGFHAAWDWAQSFLYGVADSGLMTKGHLFATHPVGRPILSGGLTGPEGSILLVPTLLLGVAVMLFTLPQTHHPGEGLSSPDLA